MNYPRPYTPRKERIRHVVKLRESGVPFDVIAAQMSISKSTAERCAAAARAKRNTMVGEAILLESEAEILREIDSAVNNLNVCYHMLPNFAKESVVRLASSLGKIRNRVNNLSKGSAFLKVKGVL